METMKSSRGFTVIEIIVVVLFLATAAVLLFMQRSSLEATQRDDQRKASINSMYFALEEVFYEKNGYYPSKIDSKTLRSVDPTVFTDPRGNKLGSGNSDYRYEGINCGLDNKCKAYKLSSSLEKEADFTKSSRNS